jgi:ribosome-binding protein aMBF1 (putative translation factor)
MKAGLLDRDDGSFAADLRRLRTQQGLSERELAESLGRPGQCIKAYESGKSHPNQDTVNTLNLVLN